MEWEIRAVFMVIGAFLAGFIGVVTNLYLDWRRGREAKCRLARALAAEVDGLIGQLDRLQVYGTVQRAKQAADSGSPLPQEHPEFLRQSLRLTRTFPITAPDLDLLPEPIPQEISAFSTRMVGAMELMNMAADPTRSWLTERDRGNDSQHLRSRACEALGRALEDLDALYETHRRLRAHLDASAAGESVSFRTWVRSCLPSLRAATGETA
jgi:hypothetical protein